MATFLVQQQELAAQMGLDPTNTNVATLLKRWLNTSQRMILGAFDWPFLRSSNPLEIQTVADLTTGTISTTAGSTTITFSSAPAVSVAGRFVQTSSSNDWYRIASHTALSTSATLATAAIYNLTAGTYTVRKIYYSTSSAVDRILQIRQSITPYQLEEYTPERFNAVFPNPTATGNPLMYMISGKDSSDLWQFMVWPTPNTVINLYVDYLQIVTDLSADADISIIPVKWHTSVMLEGAKMMGYMFLDDARYDEAKMNFGQMLEDMKKNMMPGLKLQRSLRSVESFPILNEFPFPLNNYPNV